MLSIARLAMLAHPAVGADRMTAAALAAMRRPQIDVAVLACTTGKIIALAETLRLDPRSWIFQKINHSDVHPKMIEVHELIPKNPHLENAAYALALRLLAHQARA